MPRLIVGVNVGAERFLRSLDHVRDPQLQREIVGSIRSLLFLDLDRAPGKLHLHPLTGKTGRSVCNPSTRVPIWTIHVTANDAYKASFTLEGGVAYLRCIKKHDALDDDP